ncbi:MAG: pyridoxal phosphate-dependent aminotransferase [Armatimonadetes bacterium]|nr:pyridoxal phosphate-dependent aminotransferase [Armatimonadota bacterium]
MPADRIKGLAPSPTLALMAKVQELRAQGADVVSFAAGEPDFATPEPVREAAIQAIRDGFTRYTAGAGMPELRAAVARKLKRENGVSVDPNQVIVSCGAKHAVFNALMAVCNPGDEVIMIVPCWPTYREQILLAGGTPIAVRTGASNEYVPTMDQLREAVTGRTAAIIVNSPCNPTGAVFPRSTMKEIAALALRHELYVISDEIYEQHVYDGEKHVSVASLGREIADRTITVGGVSKSFAMTGWRIGWSASSPEIARAISTIQDQVTSNASSVSQKAALCALEMPSDIAQNMVGEFDKRRRFMLEELAKIPGLNCYRPKGAFYAFPDLSSVIGGRVGDDAELAIFLLEEHKVACVPGSAFSGAGHLRLTYAMGRDEIAEGLRRLSEGVRSLS